MISKSINKTKKKRFQSFNGSLEEQNNYNKKNDSHSTL